MLLAPSAGRQLLLILGGRTGTQRSSHAELIGETKKATNNSWYSGERTQAKAIVGVRSLTILVDLSQADLGIQKGDILEAYVVADKIIIEKTRNGGFRDD